MRTGNAMAASFAGKSGVMHMLSAILVAGLLAGPMAAQAEPFAYVTNIVFENVSVIDTASNTVTATVPVGSSPAGVAVTPDGAHAYVANEHSDSVSVIDTASNTVTATVPVGGAPFGVAITPDGDHLYVANANSNTVSVIDTASNTVTATVPVGDVPVGVAITPDGAHAYVANETSDTVSVIDTASNTVTATVPVGDVPYGVAITPDGAHAYVANRNSDSVSVIDTASNTVTATVPVGDGPYGVAITPDGAHAYVANEHSDSVSVIDTASNTVTATVPVGDFPRNVAITPDGAYAYVADLAVSVIDTATNTVTATVPVGGIPLFVAITPTPLDVDGDGDGITDSVDSLPVTPSDAFNDGGGTFGSITDRAGLTVTIEDAASPDGVRVVVGAGSGQVTLDACGFTETVDAASELIITCGSVTLNVIQGAAQVLIDGLGTVVSVPAGVTAAVTDNGDGTVLIQNVGGGGVVSVTVDGEQTTIGPGDSQTYAVVYQFVGFFSPVDNVPTLNSVKAGSAIPVKFGLGSDQGLNIFASGYPKSQKIGCDTSAPLDAIEETVAAGSSSLSYAAGADQYTYVWKTDKAWAGTCRQFVLRLDDSTERAAIFKFK